MLQRCNVRLDPRMCFTEQDLQSLADPRRTMIDPVQVLACEMEDAFVLDFMAGELTADPRGRRFCRAHRELSRVPSPAVASAELARPEQGRLSMAVTGAFKIPTLRNVELTGPYMHNGGMKSLEEVVEFYNRGGNGTNRHHSATLVFPQGFTEQNKSDLVAFLKALTDERVRWERAPFDHPELRVPHGHEDGENALGPQFANDSYLHVPAVGRNGRSAEQGPLKSFDSYLQP